MASSSTRIPLLLFLLLPSALTANEGISAFNKCGLKSGRSCYDKPGALRLKLIIIFTILVAGLVGVCLPLISHSFPICRVDSNPFVLIKAFALVAYPHQQGDSWHPPPRPRWCTPGCRLHRVRLLLHGRSRGRFDHTASAATDRRGGLNLYIEELIEGARREFGSRYECRFQWVDVELKELRQYVAERVDLMVERGLVEEVRGMFNPESGYFGSF